MAINRSSIKQFSKFSLFAKQVVQGFLTGLHRSPFHGFSVEKCVIEIEKSAKKQSGDSIERKLSWIEGAYAAIEPVLKAYHLG